MMAVVYTAEEVARLLSVSIGRVYELARSGRLPVVRIGRQVRIPVAAFDEWLSTGGYTLGGGWRREAA